MRIRPEKKWGLVPLCLLMLLALAHATLPHTLRYLKSGSPVYFADSDDTDLYLNYSSHAFHHGGLALKDPITDSVGTFVPDTQLMPFVLAAKFLGLHPTHIPILWRIWAGISLALTVFLLLRLLIGSAWAASLSGAILLTDAGFLSASPFLRQVQVALQLAGENSESLLSIFPQIHLQWRIITPGLSLGVLLLQITFILSARKQEGHARIALAALATGALFYVYFYFWTAALLALGLCFLVDRSARALYAKITVLGFIIGAPALFMSAALKKNSHPEALPRLDFFLPIDRFSEFLIPKAAIATIFLTWILLLKLPNNRFPKNIFYYPAALALSALLLLNHQTLTGLQIQNFHYSYVYGPIGYISLLAIGARLLISLMGERKVIIGLALTSIITIPIGFYTRAIESNKTKESIALLDAYHIAKALAEGAAIPISSDIIAGDIKIASQLSIQRGLRPYAGMMLSLSPKISDQEWNDRLSKNSAIQGMSRASFQKEQEAAALHYPWGKWGRDEALRHKLFDDRIASFDGSMQNLLTTIDEGKIRWIVASRNVPSLWSEFFDNKNFRIAAEKNDWLLIERLTNF